MKKIINFSSNQLIHTGAQTVIWQGQSVPGIGFQLGGLVVCFKALCSIAWP